MIIDKFLQVSNEQAVTASAASTNVIDFGHANPTHDDMKMAFTTDAAATAAGAATVTFSIQDSADNSSWADVVASGAIGKATLVAGAQVVLEMPFKTRRYVRGYYTVATGPLTAGAFSAQYVSGTQQNMAYPDSPRIA